MFCGFQLANTLAEKSVNDVQLLKPSTIRLVVVKGVLNEVSPLDRHALVKFTLFALVPSFAPAGNELRAEQSLNAEVKLVHSGAWTVPKLVRLGEPFHP